MYNRAGTKASKFRNHGYLPIMKSFKLTSCDYIGTYLVMCNCTINSDTRKNLSTVDKDFKPFRQILTTTLVIFADSVMDKQTFEPLEGFVKEPSKVFFDLRSSPTGYPYTTPCGIQISIPYSTSL